MMNQNVDFVRIIVENVVARVRSCVTVVYLEKIVTDKGTVIGLVVCINVRIVGFGMCKTTGTNLTSLNFRYSHRKCLNCLTNALRFWRIKMTNQINDKKGAINPKEIAGKVKNSHSCVSQSVMAELGIAMMEGARKYGRHNYRVTDIVASTYYDATRRHLDAWWEGEDIDPDSGLHHIVKAIASLVVCRDGMIQKKLCDDRPPKTPPEFNEHIAKLVASVLDKYPESKEPCINTYLGPVEVQKALCKSAEPDRVTAYMCHSIRGKKGVEATQQEMIDNNNKAIEAGERLRLEHPELDVYVPGDHDEFVMIGYESGTLTEKQILDIDCAVVERRDAIVMYAEDGYLSRGMVTEIKYAKKHKKLVWWYDGLELYKNLNCFIDENPEEWQKVCW